jgi:hypothetical protein
MLGKQLGERRIFLGEDTLVKINVPAALSPNGSNWGGEGDYLGFLVCISVL